MLVGDEHMDRPSSNAGGLEAVVSGKPGYVDVRRENLRLRREGLAGGDVVIPELYRACSTRGGIQYAPISSLVRRYMPSEAETR